jgi:hypothetical protein
MQCDTLKYQEPVTQWHSGTVTHAIYLESSHKEISVKAERCSVQYKWHVQALLNTHLRGRCDGCQVRAYSLHDPLTPHPESNCDASTPIKQKIYWGLCFLLHISFSVGQPYCYHWTNSITGTSCSYLLPHNYMLQTVLHYYKIVNTVIKIVSPDISKQVGSASAVCSSGPVFKSWPKVSSW